MPEPEGRQQLYLPFMDSEWMEQYGNNTTVPFALPPACLTASGACRSRVFYERASQSLPPQEPIDFCTASQRTLPRVVWANKPSNTQLWCCESCEDCIRATHSTFFLIDSRYWTVPSSITPRPLSSKPDQHARTLRSAQHR